MVTVSDMTTFMCVSGGVPQGREVVSLVALDSGSSCDTFVVFAIERQKQNTRYM